jgi:hypothetical protein
MKKPVVPAVLAVAAVVALILVDAWSTSGKSEKQRLAELEQFHSHIQKQQQQRQ